jgi:hypothetical protein
MNRLGNGLGEFNSADAGLTAFTRTSTCEMATRFEAWRISPITVPLGRWSLITAAQPKTAKPEESYVRLPHSSGGSAS